MAKDNVSVIPVLAFKDFARLTREQKEEYKNNMGK